MHKVDRTIVMEAGEIVEMGTYQELIEARGGFAKLIAEHVNENNTDGESADEDESKAQEEEAEKPKEHKLIAAEERVIGEVSRKVYALYASALGGFGVMIVLFIFFFFEQLSKVAADW
jgi:ABC-type multidrug transport system ATPase subunit